MKTNTHRFLRRTAQVCIGVVICGVCLFCTRFVQQVYAAYPDVASDDPFLEIYTHLSDQGIMNPLPDGSFGPLYPMSRAATVVAALRAAGSYVPPVPNPDALPPDTDPNSWYSASISRARELRVISPEGNFRPTETVSKAEALAMIFHALNIDVYKYADRSYTNDLALDVANDSWYAPYFAVARKYHIADLPADRHYHPDKPLTRKEVAAYIYRTLRVYYADEATLRQIEMEAEIRDFMNLVSANKITEAQPKINVIIALAEEMLEADHTSDSLAAHMLSLALEDFAAGLRAYNRGDKLETIEYMHIASIKLDQIQGQDNQALAKVIDDFQYIVSDVMVSLSPSRQGTVIASPQY